MSDILNATALNEIKELMGEAFPSLVERFEALSADYLSKIESGVATDDAKQVVEAAHPLKSSSRQLAADHVADIAAHLEAKGKEHGAITDDMKQSASQLSAAMSDAITALKAAC